MGLRSVARASHPLPTAGVTLIALLLAVAWGLDAVRVALVAATILTNQLSIGLSNDAIDAPRDRAVGRVDKPVARGELTVRAAWAVAISCGIASLVLGAVLGPLAGAANLVFLGAGWLYNAGLKRTVWSVACYAVGFAAFPAVVAFAATRPVVLGWSVPVAGALLGIAAHIANTLPDVDADRTTGVRGFPHRISLRANAVIAGASLAGASIALLVGLRPPILVAVGAVIVAVVLAYGTTAAVITRPRSRVTFVLIIAAALLAVGLLALSGSSAP